MYLHGVSFMDAYIRWAMFKPAVSQGVVLWLVLQLLHTITIFVYIVV